MSTLQAPATMLGQYNDLFYSLLKPCSRRLMQLQNPLAAREAMIPSPWPSERPDCRLLETNDFVSFLAVFPCGLFSLVDRFS